MRAQPQVGHVCHALPRPKLLRVCPVLGMLSQVGHMSPALPRSKLLRFLVFYEGPVLGEPYMSHSSQAQLVQTPKFSVRATAPGGFFVSCTSQG